MPDTHSLLEFLAGNARRAALLFFACGALLMLSFAPFGVYVVAPVLLWPLLFVFLELPPRRAAFCGFWFGAGLFLAGTYWLYVSIHVFGEAPLLLAIFLMVALVLIMALYYAATGWLVARLCAGRPLRLLVVAPAVWVAIEWVRGWILSGFPWMSLGYGQIDSPLAGFAPLLGVYGVSLAVVFSAGGFLVASLTRRRQRWIVALLALFPWPAGLALGKVEWTEAAGPPLAATIVQGGISQDRKWDRDQLLPTLTLYRESLLQHADSDLVIWPEVAIPALLHQVEDFVDILRADVDRQGQSLVFGILEHDRQAGNIYNSVVLLDRGGRQVYRKRHLVPFGEYFPVPDFVREWMRLMSLPNTDLTAGDDVQPLLRTAGGQQLAVAICYEDAYGAEQLYALPAATILINVSNDAWFGDTIAPHQHLEIARMRALEAGRPVIRATNTGVSTFIAADGSSAETAPQFEMAALTAAIVPRRGLTPYARFGNLPVVLLTLAVLASYGWRQYRARIIQSTD